MPEIKSKAILYHAQLSFNDKGRSMKGLALSRAFGPARIVWVCTSKMVGELGRNYKYSKHYSTKKEKLYHKDLYIYPFFLNNNLSNFPGGKFSKK